MCDYIDKLPEEEKPKTYSAWVKVIRKCGYEVLSGHYEENEDKPCNFAGTIISLVLILAFDQ